MPEGESASHLTSGLAAPSSAAAATLRHDDADAAPATGASAATTGAANANTDETTTSGGDTHVVSFEGARDRIIVVARKMTTQRWLVGSDEGDAFVKHVFKTFMLTPIFYVSGNLSIAGIFVALLHDIEDKRWYWLFVCAGVWLPLVSLAESRVAHLGWLVCCQHSTAQHSTHVAHA